MGQPQVYIYTDGACRSNPGPGGWGALIIYGGTEKAIGGAEKYTTNNRMELTAAIQGLSHVKYDRCVIHLVTDSMYLKDGITQWLSNWKKNDWKNNQGKLIKNQDLWMQLDELNSNKEIHWEWIKGHSGHFGNERADRIANEHIDKMIEEEGLDIDELNSAASSYAEEESKKKESEVLSLEKLKEEMLK